MINELPDMTLKVIGIVKNEMKEPGVPPNMSEIVSEILLYDKYEGAADHIDAYSDITVLYWYHKLIPEGPVSYMTHPRARKENPLVGILSTRGPNRPNRIGMCGARLIEARGNILKVVGIDAIDGTPVIDIKPYNSILDSRTDVTIQEYSKG